MIGAGRGGACQSARKKRQNGERRLPRLRRRKRFSPFSVAGDRVFLSARKSLFSCYLFSTLYCFLCGRPGGLSCAAQSRLCRLCPALRARVSIPDAVVCCDRSGHAPLSRRYLRSPHPGKRPPGCKEPRRFAHALFVVAAGPCSALLWCMSPV